MMEKQEFGFRTAVAVDRMDPVFETGGQMLGEDLGVEAHLLQMLLELQHLIGDGVSTGSPGVELVDRGVALHLVATIA